MSVIEITEGVALKVRDTVAAGLVEGAGKPVPGQMCVEAAVCYALGLPHGDDPGCVAPSLRRLKIRLNDSRWSSNQARAEGLKRLALVQLGSLGVVDDAAFRRRVIDMTIRKAVPIGLRAAAKVNPKHAQTLEACAVRCEQEGTREACEEARKVARAAYAAAAAAAAAAADAADAADAAAYAAYAAYATYAAKAAACAVDAAIYVANAAADAAADAADADAASAAACADAAASVRTRDRVLAEYAEHVVQILIDMQAPGVQWLRLLEGRS
jgi:hypothetical protein